MVENYKKAVLDRFQDAVVLYCAERYIASLYMSGYVIEIGIKVEFQRLSAIKIDNQDKMMRVINLLSHKSEQLPLSLKEFLDLTQKIKQVNDTRIFDVIFKKQSEKHNIKKFLNELKTWKETIGEQSFNCDKYDISEKCDWKTDLRYGDDFKDEFKTCSNDKENARILAFKAFDMARIFLKEVVFLTTEELQLIQQYEEKIDSNINDIIELNNNSINTDLGL